jgi:hypothetical protein
MRNVRNNLDTTARLPVGSDCDLLLRGLSAVGPDAQLPAQLVISRMAFQQM